MPPMTGPGIVWIKVESFPTKEQIMERTAAPAITPVSYTHLDVYKRQGIHEAAHNQKQQVDQQQDQHIVGGQSADSLCDHVLSLIHI